MFEELANKEKAFGTMYLVETCPGFHERVVLGLLWTEKLARQIEVLSVVEGFVLKRLSQKQRGEEEEASLTVINIIIHKLTSLG